MRRTSTWMAAAVLAATCVAGTGDALATERTGGGAPEGRYDYSFVSGIVPGVIPSNGTGHTVYDGRAKAWQTQVVTNFLIPAASYTIVASRADGSEPTEICSYVNDAFGSGGCERTNHQLAAMEKVVSRLNPVGNSVEPARATLVDHPAPPAPGEITFTR